MSFFAILFALLIEQARPLARSNPIHAGLRAWALSVCRSFDVGQSQYGWVAWGLAVLVPSLTVLAVHWALLHWLGWPLALAWSVAVLYITLGSATISRPFAMRWTTVMRPRLVRAWRSGSRWTPASCHAARSCAM